MRILFVGDIVGKPGRKAVSELIPSLRREFQLDMVIANGENAAGGQGLTPGTADEILKSGVDVVTSGNHIWDHRDILPYLEGDLPVIRPLNYPDGVPGKGFLILNRVLVVNLMGRTFIGNFECPFRTADALLKRLENKTPVIIVDFHAEATSEKNALARYLDGRVSAVLGTHTHIGTVDARILPGGTAFVTDVGMTGPTHSIIGDDIEGVISRFLTLIPRRLSVGKGKAFLNSVLLNIDEQTGKAVDICRIDRKVKLEDYDAVSNES